MSAEARGALCEACGGPYDMTLGITRLCSGCVEAWRASTAIARAEAEYRRQFTDWLRTKQAERANGGKG